MKWRVTGILLCAMWCGLACQSNSYRKNATFGQVTDASIAKGEVLAKTYCQSCHQLPDPSLLSAGKWNNGVLPQMGPRLGIFYYGYAQYPSAVDDPNIGSSFYPSQQVLSFVDWQHIIDYYTALSPDSLQAAASDVPIQANDQLFTPLPAGRDFAYDNPMTGCVYAPVSAGTYHLFVTDMSRKNIVSVNQQLQQFDSVSFRYPVVDVVQTADTLYVASIGVLTPNDGQTGTIQQLMVQNGRFASLPVVLADSLRRPVHIDVVDMDKDGRKDLLVCEFGNLKGALSWLQNKGNNTYERKVLRNAPGAIATVVRDDNGDGLPDLYVLFAQGDEQIVHFINMGSGRFSQEPLLHFPPAYGSSYFEMIDMNNDGFEDILYTCGDNADYSIELKPYHGVYLFTNDGHNHFSQSFFFHINGCFKAMATISTMMAIRI